MRSVNLVWKKVEAKREIYFKNLPAVGPEVGPSVVRGVRGAEVRGVTGAEVRGVRGAEVRGVRGAEVRGVTGAEVRGVAGAEVDPWGPSVEEKHSLINLYNFIALKETFAYIHNLFPYFVVW